MNSGSCTLLGDLPPEALVIVAGARRAVLTTIDEQGGPHAVPICFAVTGTDIVTPIDHKPKSTTALARVRHIQSRPVATVLFDRYDDDWANLGWVMVRGSARLEDPRIARESLAARYPQYRARPPQGELIVVTPRRINWWLKK